MTRGLMVVLTFVAAAAQAQEAKKATDGTSRAALQKGEPSAMVAPRSVPDPRLGTSASVGGILDKSADCSVVQTLRGGGAPLVRRYPAPRRTRASLPESGSEQDSYVSAVVRCGQLYIFQIWSESKDAWAAKGARLEASSGELLHVNELFFDKVHHASSINTIVAVAPPGANVTRLKLTLISEGDRAVVLEVRDIP